MDVAKVLLSWVLEEASLEFYSCLCFSRNGVALVFLKFCARERSRDLYL
jgi:hypothetical protein